MVRRTRPKQSLINERVKARKHLAFIGRFSADCFAPQSLGQAAKHPFGVQGGRSKDISLIRVVRNVGVACTLY
jgi:hypothetical protein